jgi:hypothetical protein
MKKRYRDISYKRIVLKVLFCFFAVLGTSSVDLNTYAGCGPDYIITGRTTYNSDQLGESDVDNTISIQNSVGDEIDRFTMGPYGEWYVLRIPTEDGAGSPCDKVVGTKNEDYYLFINGLPTAQSPIDIESIDEGKRQYVLDIGEEKQESNNDNPGSSCFIGDILGPFLRWFL